MTQDKKFQQHLHVFRGVAIIFIVCAHTIPSFNWTSQPLIGRFLDSIFNQSSIFFFFIAGYLFQHLSSKFSFKNYLKQKLKTVILPYLILSIPALFVFTQLVHREGVWSWFYTLPQWQQVALFLLTGKHLAPLWFVPTIALFYLIAPILLTIDRRAPKLYWLIIPLWGLSIYLGRDGTWGPIDKAIYLLPVYLAGMAFSHFYTAAESLSYRAWAPLAIATIIGIFGYTFELPEPPSYLMVMKLPMAFLLTVLLHRWHHLIGNKLDYIAHISFGIFFIHAYFISAIKVATVYFFHRRIYTGDAASDFSGSIFYFFIYAAAVLLLSILSIRVAQRLLGKNSRMVIGA